MTGHILTVSTENQAVRQRIAARLDAFTPPAGLTLTTTGDEELNAVDPLIMILVVAFATGVAGGVGKEVGTEVAAAAIPAAKKGLRSLIDFIKDGLAPGELVTLDLNGHVLPLSGDETEIGKFVDAVVPE